MAVDDRYKRASAVAFQHVFQHTLHTDTTSGVDTEERIAALWGYSGITPDAPVGWTNIIIQIQDVASGKYITGPARYKLR